MGRHADRRVKGRPDMVRKTDIQQTDRQTDRQGLGMSGWWVLRQNGSGQILKQKYFRIRAQKDVYMAYLSIEYQTVKTRSLKGYIDPKTGRERERDRQRERDRERERERKFQAWVGRRTAL